MKKLIGSSVTSSAKSLTVALIMMALTIGLLVFGQMLIKHFIATQSFVEQAHVKSHKKSDLLNKLNSGLSELGVKSAFEIFIEHKSTTEAANVERHLSDIKYTIAQYQEIKHISTTESIALVQLTSVLEKIQDNYLLATNLIDTNNNDKLNELNDAINQDEINSSLVALQKAFKQQKINDGQVSTEKMNSVITFITFGSGFILIILAVGVYVLSMYRRHQRELDSLNHHNDQLTTIFQHNPLATIHYNSQGQIEHANAKALILFGANAPALAAVNIVDLISPADQSAFSQFSQQDFSDQFTQSTAPSKNINIVNQRGHEIPVDISVNNFKQHDQTSRVITFRNRIDNKRTLKLMSENQLMLNQAQQIANIGSWNWELSSDKLIWSDQAYRIYGFKPGEIEITNDILMSTIPPLERELVGNAINESVIFNKEYHIVHSIIRVDGTTAIVEEHGKVIRDDDNKAVRMIGTVHDITLQKQTEQQLSLSTNVFEHTTEAIVVTDVSNKILKTNAAFERITGFKETEVCTMELDAVLRANYFDQSFYQAIRDQLNTTDNWQGEVWNVRKNGEVYPARQNISVIKNVDGEIVQYLYIFSDVSQHKLTEKNIREIAKFDQLTLLPNRSVFIERLRQTIACTSDDKITAVFSIALNRSSADDLTLEKHDKDQLISTTANLISHLIRKQDSVMRAGQNEFNVIIRDLSSGEDAYIIAEKIINELTLPLTLSDKKVVPGCCIGIALHPTHTDIDTDSDSQNNSYYDLIKYADAAMSSAKNNYAHGTRIFNPDMLLDYSDNEHQGHELRRAIESQELSVNFEPTIDLTNDRLNAATAKIIWTHPELGNISYDSFKSIAQQARLNESLFNWLLEEACQQASQWSASTLGNVTIDVELAPILLEKPGISEKISYILTTYQLKPQRLRLSMSQVPMEDNGEVAIAELEKIKELGVTINFIRLDNSELAIKDIKRIGFNSITTSGSLNYDSFPADMLNQIQNTIAMVNSLPLSETLTQNPMLIALATITDLEKTSSKHYMTGRHLSHDDLLELSNAINANNILGQRTANS